MRVSVWRRAFPKRRFVVPCSVRSSKSGEGLSPRRRRRFLKRIMRGRSHSSRRFQTRGFIRICHDAGLKRLKMETRRRLSRAKAIKYVLNLVLKQLIIFVIVKKGSSAEEDDDDDEVESSDGEDAADAQTVRHVKEEPGQVSLVVLEEEVERAPDGDQEVEGVDSTVTVGEPQGISGVKRNCFISKLLLIYRFPTVCFLCAGNSFQRPFYIGKGTASFVSE